MQRLIFRTIVLLLLVSPPGLSAVSAAETEDAAGQPSAQLEKEHDITLKMLDAASREAAQIRKTGTLNTERILKMQDFFSNFVDRCHHAKEERFYFPAAKFYDGPDIDRLTAELVNEHDYARTLLQEVAYMLRQESDVEPALVADRLDRYAEMIRAHIGKENQSLYRQADLVLPVAEKAGMMQGFSRVEQQELGGGFHEKYHALAMELLE